VTPNLPTVHQFPVNKREYALKPMNCPGGMLYYLSHIHSYRELPLRVAEIGNVHRYEPSGSLSGLFRVRSFHQDDAHIFLSIDGVQDEIKKLMEMFFNCYDHFGFKNINS
jgi:threonyl-tRNA synthetase